MSCERLQHFFNEKHTNGRINGQGGLSPKTLKNMYNMIHKAFEQACKNNLIPKNVTQYVVLPKRAKKDIEILTVDEQKHLLENIHSERLGFAILLTLSTGLRLGEVCALKWGDIDFERKTISVRRTLQRLCKTEDEKTTSTNKTIIVEGPVKTDNSHREIPIQNKIFDKLLKYQLQQQDEKDVA